MLLSLLIIFTILTATGFPIVFFLLPKTNIVFKICSAAYFSSMVLIVIISILLRMSLDINLSLPIFLLISASLWCGAFKKKLLVVSISLNKEIVKNLLLIGFILFVSLIPLVYPMMMRAYGIFHMAPDYYGYAMSTSYFQQQNITENFRKTNEKVEKIRENPKLSTWNIGDLREAVTVDFTINANRYGIQSLAAVLDNSIFRDNSGFKLLYPLIFIALTTILSSVYELTIIHRLKKIYAVFALILVGFNFNHLIAIYEGEIGSIFILAVPILLGIYIFNLDRDNKSFRGIVWSIVIGLALLFSSSLIIYQEIMGVLFLFLCCVLLYLLLRKEFKKIMNLILGGVFFLFLNLDIIKDFILSILSRFNTQFSGTSLNVGFLDFLSAIGLSQPYFIVRHALINRPQNDQLFYTTVKIYIVLLITILIGALIIKILRKPYVFFYLLILLTGVFLAKMVFVNNFIVWKLSYALVPFIALSVILSLTIVRRTADEIVGRFAPSLKFILYPIRLAILAIILSSSIVVIYNYFNMYRSYIKYSDLVFAQESEAFGDGKANDEIILSMSSNQLYYMPGLLGNLYWLNANWGALYDKQHKQKQVTLFILKQVEGDEFFMRAREFFKGDIVYSNDKVILANLNVSASKFIKQNNMANIKYMKSYLKALRNKIL